MSTINTDIQFLTSSGNLSYNRNPFVVSRIRPPGPIGPNVAGLENRIQALKQENTQLAQNGAGLENRIQALTQNVIGLQNQTQKLTQENMQLTQNVIGLQNQTQELTQENAQLRMAGNFFKTKATAYQQKAMEFSSQLQEMPAEIERFRNTFAFSRREIMQNQQAFTAMKQKHATTLREQSDEFNDTVRTLKEQNGSLTKEIEKVKSALRKSEERIEGLAKQETESSSLIHNQHTIIQKMQHQMKELHSEISKHKSEKLQDQEKNRNTIAQFVHQNYDSSCTIVALREENEEQRNAITKVNEKLNESEQNFREFQVKQGSRNAKSTRRYESTIKELQDKLEQKNIQNQHQITELTQKNAELNKQSQLERQGFVNSSFNFEEKIQKQSTELDTNKRQLEEQSKTIGALNAQLLERSIALKKLEDEHTKLKKTHYNKLGEFIEMKAKLSTAESSNRAVVLQQITTLSVTTEPLKNARTAFTSQQQ